MNVKLKSGIALLVAVAFGLYVWHIIPQTIQSRMAGQRYVVSLGDSVAAGAGLSGKPARGADICDVADTAFPYVLGQTLHEPVEQFACSGATIAANSTSGSNNLLQTQYAQAKPFLNGGDVVVTAGANDISWLNLLLNCARSACDATSQPALQPKLQSLQQNMTELLTKIQQNHPHELVVNTYYGLLDTGDTCFAQYGITPAKVAYIASEQAALNGIITAAAHAAHATVVNIDFNGHLICSDTPYIQTITDAAPLHPTVSGQQRIAQQDAEAFKR